MEVLQYARSHGLAREHLLDDDIDLPDLHRTGPLLTRTEDALTISVPHQFPAPEKLGLDTQARRFLHAVLTLPDEHGQIDWEESSQIRPSRLKLDEPMLRTDNETDVKTFAKTKERASRLRLSLGKVEINEEMDEGLTWPSSALELPNHYDRLARSEKLAIPKDALLYLKDLVSVGGQSPDHEELVENEISYRKVRNQCFLGGSFSQPNSMLL